MAIVRSSHGAADPRPSAWVDALVLTAIGACMAGLVAFLRRWEAPLRPVTTIDLSPRALPVYTLLSLGRGVAAYALSLAFTFVYGTIAAHDVRAERVMIPVLDVLQGIPVLGFLPGLVLGMVALFPHSNVGLELACVLMIFTGQVWNMTFSFYGSLRAVPDDLREVARLHGFGWWKRFDTLEVPFATIGLVWNSMMSMAGGWFFLTVTEAFTLGDRDFRLPGIGAYMAAAIDAGDRGAMAAAIVAMVVMIVLVDQVIWRPALAWAQKFKVEETDAADAPRSALLQLLRRSRVPAALGAATSSLTTAIRASWRAVMPAAAVRVERSLARLAGGVTAAGVALLATWGVGHLGHLVLSIPGREWGVLAGCLALTALRTAAALLLGALWAVPVGVWIGLSPARTRLFQPLIQVAASFPAPMIFPIATMALLVTGIPFAWGCVLLMLLGSQWYILFNVLAGATAMPHDMREAADVYGVAGWTRWRTLYLPAVFPHLVTGLVTGAGGAWNASIVSEYVRFRGRTLVAPGLGSLITQASESANFPLLAAGVMTMSLALVVLNRTAWRRLHHLADTRYGLNR